MITGFGRAAVDGCGLLRTFFRVMLPLSIGVTPASTTAP